MLLVTIFICASNVAKCNYDSARVVHTKFMEGVVCGLPYQQAALTSLIGPDEQVVVRCKMRNTKPTEP